MKERLEVISFRQKVLIWTFLIFLLISFLSPITYDDWSNYLIGKNGLNSIIDNMIYMYNHWEGRLISRFLIGLLTYNKIIFNIVFSLLMSGVVYSINTLIGKVQNKYYYLIAPIGLLLVPSATFAQNYTWINGAVTFTFPAALTIIYFTYLFKKERLTLSWKEIVFLSILNIIAPMFVENIGIAFVIINILVLGHKVMIKDNDKYFYLLFTLLSAFSMAIMLMSPGSIIKMNSEAHFYSLSLIDKLSMNVSSFINYTFVQNLLVMILMLIPINYVIGKKLGKFTYYRLIAVAFNLIPLFSIICNLSILAPVNLNLLISRYDGIFLVEKGYFAFYWLLFLLLFIYSIFYIIPKGNLRQSCLCLIAASLVSTFAMMLTPDFDNRVAILYLFAMLLISIILIKNLNITVNPKVMIGLFSLLVVYYASITGITFYLDKTRTDYIKEQLAADAPVIYVKANPILLNWNYNPYSGKQIEMFKKYYNIPAEKEIKVKYLGIFGSIEETIKKK